MKSALNLCLFLFAFVISVDKSFSLNNFQIKIICKREKKESTCIKSLQKKKFELQKGNFIEIPVKPYRR